jgi:hypothetical protein
MAKQRVSADELSWIILEELGANAQSPPKWFPVAVIPDEKKGWRILLPKLDGRNVWTANVSDRVPALERRLREKYALKGD